MLVLVHRKDLVNQASARISRYNPSLWVSIDRGEYIGNIHANVIVASVQTLGVERGGSNKRINRYNSDEFGLIVCDEVHHLSQANQSYVNVLEYFNAVKSGDYDDSKLLCGFTATPNRSDNVGLEFFFDQISYQRGLRDMMTEGPQINGQVYPWLADIVAYRVSTEADISQVGVDRGDFKIGELANAVNTPERNALIVEKYKELGKDLPAFCFTVDVQHAVDVATEFNKQNIAAVAVSGQTPMSERAVISSEFMRGNIRVLASCGVLSEGIDLPVASVGLLARPTKSSLLFQQQCGRLLRPWPSPEDYASALAKGDHPEWIKPHAILVDLVDSTGRHRIQTIPTLFGLKANFNLKGKSALAVTEEIERLESANPGLDLRDCEDLEVARRRVKAFAERVDLFRAPIVPPQIRQHSRFAWLDMGNGRYQLSLPERTVLQIRENHLGQFEIHSSTNGVRELHHVAQDLASALSMADGSVPRDARQMLLANAGWRSEPPTLKQIAALRKLNREYQRIFRDETEMFDWFTKQFEQGNLDYSRGKVSQLIDSRIATIFHK
jgi:superfamily II DNA or RNA helicase